jgi:hypothetical protein
MCRLTSTAAIDTVGEGKDGAIRGRVDPRTAHIATPAPPGVASKAQSPVIAEADGTGVRGVAGWRSCRKGTAAGAEARRTPEPLQAR